MKNAVIIQDHESIPFHRGRPNNINPNEDTSMIKKVDEESKVIRQGIKESDTGSIPFHKRERGLTTLAH